MGLSGPRKRAKFPQDPNNTVWTRSSSNFGHKVLLSQGWKPGSVLGAQDASYTDNPGSLSHTQIRVRDEGLGLGARIGVQGGQDTVTGLNGLQDLLGRLNGKTKCTRLREKRSREDTRKAVYADRRWGFGNFVSGGFLVGDRIKPREEQISTGLAALSSGTTRSSTASCSKEKDIQSRQKKKERAGKLIGTASADDSKSEPIPSANTYGKIQRSKERNPETEELRMIEEHVLRARRCSEKTERKARRKARKAEKEEASRLKQQTRLDTTLSMMRLELQTPAGRRRAADGERTHARHAVRRRFIQHKQKSLTDEKALNEILMIRA
ncbi:MAG: hypothetical protein Q9202_005237 [Teloschistes flavicans]